MEIINMLLLIVVVVFTIALFIGAIITIRALLKSDFNTATIGLVLSAVVSILALLFYYQYEANKNYITAEAMIADGAKVYIDGQEVDVDKIILKDYEITIKDDYIILSKQRR